MGSGPATHLASIKNAFSLLLMSPFTSIKDISKSLFGKMSFLVTSLVYERFRNIDAIKEAKCPVFFLHGMKDKLIPHSHTLELNNNCPTVSFLQLPPEMDHNTFDYEEDLVKPFGGFVKKIEDSIASEKRRSLANPSKHPKPPAFIVTKIDESLVIYSDEKDLKSKAGESDSNESSSSDETSANDLASSGEHFEIVFDKTIYEPPLIIKQTHAKLEAISKS